MRMLKKDPKTKVDKEMEKAINTNLPNVASADIKIRTCNRQTINLTICYNQKLSFKTILLLIKCLFNEPQDKKVNENLLRRFQLSNLFFRNWKKLINFNTRSSNSTAINRVFFLLTSFHCLEKLLFL